MCRPVSERASPCRDEAVRMSVSDVPNVGAASPSPDYQACENLPIGMAPESISQPLQKSRAVAFRHNRQSVQPAYRQVLTTDHSYNNAYTENVSQRPQSFATRDELYVASRANLGACASGLPSAQAVPPTQRFATGSPQRYEENIPPNIVRQQKTADGDNFIIDALLEEVIPHAACCRNRAL